MLELLLVAGPEQPQFFLQVPLVFGHVHERSDAALERQAQHCVEHERRFAMPRDSGDDHELPQVEFQDGVELRPADAECLLCNGSPLRQVRQRIQPGRHGDVGQFDHVAHHKTPSIPSSHFGFRRLRPADHGADVFARV
jgi:hypothetical protein